jgi:hypothetical protein
VKIHSPERVKMKYKCLFDTFPFMPLFYEAYILDGVQ